MQLLAENARILWRLFGMMRGGIVSTQLYAAKALCNLASNEKCAGTLLKEKAVSDFIVIAILRTNNEEVRSVVQLVPSDLCADTIAQNCRSKECAPSASSTCLVLSSPGPKWSKRACCGL